MKNCLRLTALSILILLSGSDYSLSQEIGVFDGQNDIGIGVKPGFATYIPQTQQYVISGAGANVWAESDEFNYVWKRMKGDFILYTRAAFVGTGVDPHRKAGWMVRSSLQGNSAHLNAVVHGDGLTALQYRRTKGATTEAKRAKQTHTDVIQLERKGGKYTMRTAKFGEPFVTEELSDIDLGDEVYVGLFVGSHNKDVLETAVFRDVRISIPFEGEADNRTSMTLGSNLEVMEIATGNREII